MWVVHKRRWVKGARGWLRKSHLSGCTAEQGIGRERGDDPGKGAGIHGRGLTAHLITAREVADKQHTDGAAGSDQVLSAHRVEIAVVDRVVGIPGSRLDVEEAVALLVSGVEAEGGEIAHRPGDRP